MKVLLEYSHEQDQWHYNDGDNAINTNGYNVVSHKVVEHVWAERFCRFFDISYPKTKPPIEAMREHFKQWYIVELGEL